MPLTRRELIQSIAVTGAAMVVPGLGLAQARPLTKPIPSSGEALPLVGLGSWITFNVGNDPQARDCLRRSHARILQGGRPNDQFLADVRLRARRDRLWTEESSANPNVFRRRQGVGRRRRRRARSRSRKSRAKWGIKRFDLLQVHNLLAWEAHLDTLLRHEERGKLRYVGITTSHGRRHEDLEMIMRKHALDFVQLTYNVARPRGGGSPPPACAGKRHRRHRQPAVPAGGAHPALRG